MQKLGNWRVQIYRCTRQGLKAIPWDRAGELIRLSLGMGEFGEEEEEHLFLLLIKVYVNITLGQTEVTTQSFK